MDKSDHDEQLINYIVYLQIKAKEVYEGAKFLVKEIHELPLDAISVNSQILLQGRVAQFTTFQTCIDFHKLLEEVSNETK